MSSVWFPNILATPKCRRATAKWSPPTWSSPSLSELQLCFLPRERVYSGCFCEWAHGMFRSERGFLCLSWCVPRSTHIVAGARTSVICHPPASVSPGLGRRVCSVMPRNIRSEKKTNVAATDKRLAFF